MGLTIQSTQNGTLKEEVDAFCRHAGHVVTLAGNPNVGKSTVFNALTGLRQHTGNWPGKTVANARGYCTHHDTVYEIIDLPGTYSIQSSSAEEEIARDFICFGNADATVIVADATCLERNLNLALQILEITPRCILCVNLMDQAKKKKIRIDLPALSELLGIPVVPVCAADKSGLDALLDTVEAVCEGPDGSCYTVQYDTVIERSIARVAEVLAEQFGEFNRLSHRFIALKLLGFEERIAASVERHSGLALRENQEVARVIAEERAILADCGITQANFADKIVCSLVSAAEQIAKKAVTYEQTQYDSLDWRIDRILTGRTAGIPLMLLLLGGVFYLTMAGANYPSALLTKLFDWLGVHLDSFFAYINTPQWLHSMLVDGMYKTLAWVVAVMLPPMAIFFPIFTLLEDLGYLPRVAFNLDHIFKKCRAHGKQCLTMCMGFGCNCAGVIGARIIDSPRERLIAILTNNFVPCNGRFPTLIMLATVFLGSSVTAPLRGITATVAVLAIVVLGVGITFAVSWLLSATILKGTPSHFALELPPYRKPKIGEVIFRSVFDRTLFVLGRAAAVAAPAGIFIWIMANVHWGSASLLQHFTGILDPFARVFGLDGVILTAFILGIPANEIVIPIMMMCYLATGSLTEVASVAELGQILVQNGWTVATAVCVMLFSLLHWPCATSLLTIHKETGSIKWTIAAFIIPTVVGLLCCFAVTTIVRLFGV